MIYYIIGIRRSGIHAIANWLFPMMGDFVYLNNYELGKLNENELVVKGNVNVLIGIENKRVSEILKYCNNGKRIWVYRNVEEVVRSQYAWYTSKLKDHDFVSDRINQAIELDAEYREIQHQEAVISYNEWNTSVDYRVLVAKLLGLQFDDSNKEIVFGYGVSSFENKIG